MRSFADADTLIAAVPAGVVTDRLVLRELKNEGLVHPSGVGRGTK